MKVLIVRLSSMGDLVHTLPAVTDAARAIPGIRFDWVVDEAFADVPAWHSSVDTVITSAHRRWGRKLWHSFRNGELSRFYRAVRATKYDAIVDVQTEIKSAVVTRMARGLRCGYDAASVHEWGAQFAYRKKFFVPKAQHSIRRMRQLMALALGYPLEETEPDYGVDRSRLPRVPIQLPERFVVFIHSTSWHSKCWPEDYWRQLVGAATDAGFSVLLPWGSESERERSLRIAAGKEKTIVLPPLSISEKASILAQAQATVGCDTGLSHIAAALDIPSVSIYGATDPALIGATGKNQLHIVSDFECVRCHQTECTYPGVVEPRPSCLAGILPELVWVKLKELTIRRGGPQSSQSVG